MDKRVIVVVCLIYLMSSVFCLLDSNVTLENKEYYYGEFLRGNLTLDILDEDVDLYIGSSRENSLLLLEFIKLNNKSYECLPFNCKLGYAVFVGTTRKEIEMYPKTTSSDLGFLISGNHISINQISFSLKSNFVESFNMPISIDFFDGTYIWNFTKFSDNLFSDYNYSCYSSGKVKASNNKINKSQMYCSTFDFPDTGKIIAGIVREGSDANNKLVKISLYKKEGQNPKHVTSCDIADSENECYLSKGSTSFIEEGRYYVCVTSDHEDTNYTLNESLGDCGMIVRGENFDESTDKSAYGIYTKYNAYANASYITLPEGLVEYSKKYINKMYDNNCSRGCVLPIRFSSGVNQRIELKDILIKYTDDGVSKTTNEIYTAEKKEPKFSFRGTLNLFLGSFTVDSRVFNMYIANKHIFSEELKIKTVPMVVGLTPTTNILFRVNTTFTAIIENPIEDIVYSWVIDNKFVKNTTTNNLNYTFDKSGLYSLILTIHNGNYSHTKEFNVNVIAPSTSEINEYFETRNFEFSKLVSEIKSQPNWYNDYIWTALELGEYEKKLLEIKILLNQDTTLEGDKVTAIQNLYSYNLPTKVTHLNIISGLSYILKEEFVNESFVKKYQNFESSSEYTKAIVDWFNEYIISNYSSRTVNYTRISTPSKELMKIYEINIASSYDKPSFIIINKVDNITFGERYSEVKEGNKYVINLSSKSTKNIKFYVSDGENVSWFVVPKLEDIILSSNINYYCNYNGICEKDLNENFINCRSDCLPTESLIKYTIFILLTLLVVYTIIQQWYSKYYEKKIFPNNIQLQNLVNFIKMSKDTGLDNSEIKQKLLVEGWTEERIDYAFRVSKNKRIMFEIIPISKIESLFKNRKIKNKDSLD